MPSLASLAGVLAAMILAAAPQALAAGSLDNGFGSGGALLLAVGDGGQSAGNGIALAPSGGLRVGGEAIDATQSKFAFVRLDPNGSPGSAGITLTPLGGDAAGAGIVTQSDGKSVVAGYGFAGGGNVFGFARYLDDGSLDSGGFGSGGTLTAPIGGGNDSAARAVAAYPPDMTVAAGRALDTGVVKVALVRLLAGGSVDPGFAALFPVGDGGEAAANAVAVQGDGNVVAAGYALNGGQVRAILLRRLATGAPDAGFGGSPDGVVFVTAGDGHEAFANAVLVQPDGKLVVAGSALDGGLTKVMLARFGADGTPDAGFGSGGTVLTQVGDGDDAGAAALALQPDGKIVVAGHATDAGGTNVMVARYNADGSPDGSFGTGGVSLVPLGDDGTAEANALALQGNRAVVTGYASDGGANKTIAAALGLVDASGSDTTPPALRASLSHKRFRVGRGSSAFGARKRRRAPVGTTIRYRLSEAARVTIRVERALRGVRRGRRCVKPTKRRRGKRCTRFVRVGRLVRESPQGKSRVPFNGRVKRRALRRGRYRFVLQASDAAGNRSVTRKLNFKVVR